jgi:hypothetical protein
MHKSTKSTPRSNGTSRDAISPDVCKAKAFRDLSPENQGCGLARLELLRYTLRKGEPRHDRHR